MQNSPTSTGYDRTQVAKIHIRRIILRDTGTYNPQYARGYETYMSAATVKTMGDQVAERGKAALTPTALAGFASNMIGISAAPESNKPVNISNGWNTNRLIFVIDLAIIDIMGNETTYMVQGWTDHIGLSIQSKAIDPELVFYINNIITVKSHAGAGMTGFGNKYLNNNHVLYNTHSGHNMWSMRPQDVHQYNTSHAFGNSTMVTSDMVFDRRTQLSTSPRFSKRSNAIPTSYASTVLNSYVDAAVKIGDSGGVIDTFDEASNMAGETSSFHNPFLNEIAKHSQSSYAKGFFRWKDVLNIAPHLQNPSDSTVVYNTSGPTQKTQQHIAGQTSGWESASIETKYAVTLSQAIPALLMESLLLSVSIKCTNTVNVPGSYSGVFSTIVNAQTLYPSNARRESESFKTRLENEVLKDLSYNNQQMFDILIDANVFGETRIKVAIDGGSYYEFVTPTFCDGIIAPVITHDYGRIGALSGAFDTLVTHISDAFISTDAPQGIHPPGQSSPTIAPFF